MPGNALNYIKFERGFWTRSFRPLTPFSPVGCANVQLNLSERVNKQKFDLSLAKKFAPCRLVARLDLAKVFSYVGVAATNSLSAAS